MSDKLYRLKVKRVLEEYVEIVGEYPGDVIHKALQDPSVSGVEIYEVEELLAEHHRDSKGA